MTTENDLPTKLCSWQRMCPNVHCHNGTLDILDIRGTRLEDCAECKGTGLVYVLNGVRVPCLEQVMEGE